METKAFAQEAKGNDHLRINIDSRRLRQRKFQIKQLLIGIEPDWARTSNSWL